MIMFSKEMKMVHLFRVLILGVVLFGGATGAIATGAPPLVVYTPPEIFPEFLWYMPAGLGSAIGGLLAFFGGASVLGAAGMHWYRGHRERRRRENHFLIVVTAEAKIYREWLQLRKRNISHLLKDTPKSLVSTGNEAKGIVGELESAIALSNDLLDFHWEDTVGCDMKILAKYFLVQAGRKSLREVAKAAINEIFDVNARSKYRQEVAINTINILVQHLDDLLLELEADV